MEVMLLYTMGMLLTPYVIVGLFIAALIFEHNEWVIVSILTSAVLLFTLGFLLNMTTEYLWYGIALYVPLGIGFSCYRWYRYTDKCVERFNVAEHKKDSIAYRTLNEETLVLTQQKSRVLRWAVIWPISSLEHFLGDLADIIWRLISVYCRSVYDRISDRARSRIVTTD